MVGWTDGSILIYFDQDEATRNIVALVHWPLDGASRLHSCGPSEPRKATAGKDRAWPLCVRSCARKAARARVALFLPWELQFGDAPNRSSDHEARVDKSSQDGVRA